MVNRATYFGEFMKKTKTLSFAATAVFALTITAQAGVVDNTSLANPPGVYFGGGNANSNFTVSTTGSVELGLSAITRYVGPVVPVGNEYDVATGATVVPLKSGSAWGFVFSVNLNADGSGLLNLSDITTKLTMNDVGQGTTGFFDVLGIPDNARYGAGGACTPTVAVPCGPASSYFAFQNSEALSFAAVAAALGDPGYDINADDTYIFKLDVFNNAGALLGTDTIKVVAGKGAAVPEPITLSLFGVGIAGIAVTRRRKKAMQA
jgi:hypothetical protein